MVYWDAPIAYTAPEHLARDRAWGRDQFFTVLIPEQPALQGRKKLLAPWAKVCLCEQTGHLRGQSWEFFTFAFPGLGRMPVLKLEGKKIIKICLPPSQIYVFPFDKQWLHFFFPSRFVFFFSFKVSSSQRGKRHFAHVLICQTRHHCTLSAIPGTSPRLHWLTSAEAELPSTTLPQPQSTLFSNKDFLFFPKKKVLQLIR